MVETESIVEVGTKRDREEKKGSPDIFPNLVTFVVMFYSVIKEGADHNSFHSSCTPFLLHCPSVALIYVVKIALAIMWGMLPQHLKWVLQLHLTFTFYLDDVYLYLSSAHFT